MANDGYNGIMFLVNVYNYLNIGGGGAVVIRWCVTTLLDARADSLVLGVEMVMCTTTYTVDRN